MIITSSRLVNPNLNYVIMSDRAPILLIMCQGSHCGELGTSSVRPYPGVGEREHDQMLNIQVN